MYMVKNVLGFARAEAPRAPEEGSPAAPDLEDDDVLEPTGIKAPEEGAPGGASEGADFGVLDSMGIKGMKWLIERAGLSHDDCFEKSELRVRAKEAYQRVAESVGHSVREAEAPPRARETATGAGNPSLPRPRA